MRILVVDDDQALNRLICLFLEKQGYEVHAAADGLSAGYDAAQRVVLRVTVPHAAKQAPSIAAIFSGADWHERECFDFFGVVFENHPGLKPLLLPDDLNLHPLIKEKDRRSIYSLLPLTQVVDTQT